MTAIPRDRSRDRRIEDPTNLYVVHPLAHALVGPAVARGISANAVSIAGLGIGFAAAVCFMAWREPLWVLLGLVAATGWLVMDGLDGMVARATGSASPLGRLLDGVCDHGVFVLLYLALVLSLGSWSALWLAAAAGACHAVQSNLYEAERARFHRRAAGVADAAPDRAGTALEHGYDRLSALLTRAAAPFEHALAAAPDRQALGRAYAARAVAPMRLMALQSANTRVLAIVAACLIGDPRLFWWFEIVVLSSLAVAAILWHRRAERAAANI